MTELTSKLSGHLARLAARRQSSSAQHAPNITDHIYLQTWLIIAIFCAFAAWVAFDNDIFHIMVDTDKSYLSLVTIIVFLAASAHAAWHIAATAKRIKAANRYLDGNTDESFKPSDIPPSARTAVNLNDSGPTFVGNFLRDVSDSQALSRSKKQGRPDNHILEIYADQLRSPVEIGWFIVDLLVRLGLLGTIVGFILILRTLVDGPLPRADEIQSLLISMSGGMGTALFTTLAGLTTATLLGLQYMVLGRSVETLIASLIRINERTETDQSRADVPCRLD
ncbi:MAG: MotA/TolQ/ExbB proton channel family protein [Filomicrobium sp.]